MNKFFKTILPWILLTLGLIILLYPRFSGGKPLFPVFNYDNPATDINELVNYPFWQIPFVYTFSYITRAWGALLLAFVLGGVIAVFVPKEKMKKYMSSKSFFSYILAGISAPVMTVCSCAMIPIFGGILISGAGIGPAIPSANVLALIFTGSIISYKIMLFRLLFSLIGAIIIGYLVSLTKWGRKQEEKYSKVEAVSTDEKKLPFSEKSWKALKEAWILAKLVLPYLGAGVFVISFIERYLPTQLVVGYLTGIRGIILGAVIGVPTYTPTLVEVFLIKALITKGMSPSSALAFLIGAPMASIPSMMGVSRIIGWKCVINYAILAVIVAMMAGLVYQSFIVTL
jgi:hypothetical protein